MNMKNKLIGIIGAMSVEVEGLKQAMKSAESVTVGAIEFTKGVIGNCNVVVAKCGVGKVFAGMCAQTMIVKYAPDVIINTGVAGSLSKNIGILDIVVGERVVQHDFDTSPLGDPKGFVSGFDSVYMNCDEEYSLRLIECASSLGIKAVRGTIASGDRFVADEGQKSEIASYFGADACEMEGAAIGQVCYVNNVNFCVLRAISDGGDESAAFDYPKFVKEASARAVEIMCLALTYL